jgi:uncharacterized membrane protein YphA (DoxX/SURF4 family)
MASRLWKLRSFIAALYLSSKFCHMNYVQRLEHWGEAHHPKYLDILRIALGIFLCLKGVEFANNTAILTESMGSRFSFNTLLLSVMIQYTIFAHIVGGFLITVGLFTRLASALQIPILLGALIFVNWNVLHYFSEFFLALLTLLLLCYFLVIGSGPWSLDRIWREENKEKF